MNPFSTIRGRLAPYYQTITVSLNALISPEITQDVLVPFDNHKNMADREQATHKNSYELREATGVYLRADDSV